MNKNTILILAAAGVAFYLWKNKKPSKAAAPAPAVGGGNGANASTSPAYNGVINMLTGDLANYLKTAGGSTGHLANGVGGATAVTTPTPVDQVSGGTADDTYNADNFDYGTLQ
jgi:hypothetical protein